MLCGFCKKMQTVSCMSKKRKTRLEDLARLAGVSVATASRALNDSPAVNPQTKQAIWKLAREHSYPFRGYMPGGPTTAAANLTVVVTRPQGRGAELSDPFILELIAGIGEAARARGCDFTLSHVMPTGYAELATLLGTSRANGVIFIGQSSLHAAFNRLAESHSHFAVWGAELPKQRYCSVGGDNPLGGRRATLHLIRLGRRRIVFLGDIAAPEAMQRRQGYLAAREQSGLGVDERLTVPAHFGVQAAEAAVDALIARRVPFDGIVAASDLIALGAIRALIRAGRSVPGDVAVVGFDDLQLARYSRPALTTIRQDTMLAGRLLVAKLLNSDAAGELLSERLPTDLVVRESCGG
jgi:DNA-binding LacI/PurR family transcriptional regulator